MLKKPSQVKTKARECLLLSVTDLPAAQKMATHLPYHDLEVFAHYFGSKDPRLTVNILVQTERHADYPPLHNVAVCGFCHQPVHKSDIRGRSPGGLYCDICETKKDDGEAYD